MERIREIAESRSLAVIEDGAQAIGASRDGIKVGNFWGYGVFELFPVEEFGRAWRRRNGFDKQRLSCERSARAAHHGMEPKYYHKRVGGNFRLDALQAAGLLAKIPHLDKWGDMRRANAAFYNDAFSSSGTVVIPYIDPRNRSIYNQYIISVNNRDEVLAHLREKQIGCEIYYPLPLHVQECSRNLDIPKGIFRTANTPRSTR